jgi:hypothetical protein
MYPWPHVFVWALLEIPWPYGTRVTSYYRSAESNRRVGGMPDSQHQLGTAVDLVAPFGEFDPFVLAQAEAVGLTLVPERSHLHVQLWRAGVARRGGLFRDA